MDAFWAVGTQPHPPSLGDDVEGNAVLALELGRDAESPCGVVLGLVLPCPRPRAGGMPLPDLAEAAGEFDGRAAVRSAHSPECIHRLPTRFAAPCSDALA